MAVNVQLEWTPNPSTLKYVVDQPLLPRGAFNYTEKSVAQAESPLAARLMDIPGVVAVMVGTHFVTVTKGDQGEWDELNEAVMATLDQHLGEGGAVLNEGVLEQRAAQQAGTPIESRIRDILEAEIRPAVMMDGGDITLDRFEDGVVYLHMKGSCSGCPSSTMTLKMGIESRLRDVLPEVQEVVAL